jgi:HAD superfamily hydrolase (TIGR01549 family)
MTYNNIVFDIDGTLIDTEEAMLRSLQRTVQETDGRTLEVDDLRFIFGMTAEDALRSLGIKDVAQAFLLWKDHYLRAASGVRVFPGVESLLRELRARSIRLGVLSSKTRYEYGTDFLPFGLGGYFDLAILAEDSLKHKPDPEPMLAYLARSEAQAAEVLYIGDRVYDMQCAKGAGVDFALALWSRRDSGDIEARYYLQRPEDVLKALATGAGGKQPV